jgi:hypothetical protein
VKDVTGAYLAYQVHPGHAGLVDEVIDWYDGTAADIERTVMPSAADAFALKRWAAHGYETDPASLGDAGSWTQLNERDLTEVDQPVLPDGFRFRTADEAGPQAAVQAHVDAWAPSTYTAEGYQGVRQTATSAAGFRGFGLLSADLPGAEREYGLSGIRAMLDDNGIVDLELEGIPYWWDDGPRRAESDRIRPDLLRAAETLGARHVKVTPAAVTERAALEWRQAMAGRQRGPEHESFEIRRLRVGRLPGRSSPPAAAASHARP